MESRWASISTRTDGEPDKDDIGKDTAKSIYLERSSLKSRDDFGLGTAMTPNIK